MVILEAFIQIFKPFTLLAMTFGVAWGIICGVLPGLGATIGIALLIPFTFGMDPMVALPMVAGVYVGAMYGGGITSIMLGVPGTSAAAATVFDGHPLAQKGMANKALTTSVAASAIGGMVSAIALLTIAPPLAKASLAFGPHEYFLLAIFGLTIIAALSPNSLIKGVLAGLFGLLLSTVGIDPVTGFMRFTFGQMYLFDGFPVLPLILGLFAFPRCLQLVYDLVQTGAAQISSAAARGGGPAIKFAELLGMRRTLARSSLIGTLIGILPGAGANIACFVGYALAKRSAKDPASFGRGNPEGVAAAEAANNAVVGGSLVPLLTLSIPGSATAAVVLGALMIHGLVPGPQLFQKYADVTYTFIGAAFFANIVMFLLGWYGSRLFAKVVDIPVFILAPIMLLISLVGSFATRQYVFDIWVTVGIGIVCYFLTKADFPMPSVLLGVILGPIAESGFRRAMLISGNDLTSFFSRPLSLLLIALTLLSLYAGWQMYRSDAAGSAGMADGDSGDASASA